MAWCCQATSHCLSQGWCRSFSPYGITRPQWVDLIMYAAILKHVGIKLFFIYQICVCGVIWLSFCRFTVINPISLTHFDLMNKLRHALACIQFIWNFNLINIVVLTGCYSTGFPTKVISNLSLIKLLSIPGSVVYGLLLLGNQAWPDGFHGINWI